MIVLKRIISVFALFLLAFSINFNLSSAEEAHSPDNKPPETLVYYNSWPSDQETPLFKGYKMAPKIPINIYVFKDITSQLIKTIQPNELITLITADYYAYPSKSSILILTPNYGLKPGDTIYLMGYIGGGDCLVWYNHNIFYVPAEGIEGVKYYKEQRLDVPMWARLVGQLPLAPNLWLYVKTSDNKFGWIKYDSYHDWQSFGPSIFVQ